jgi:dethiobiotin synthetase/adenosylmethionine--8-amino-7-oxononanoate aminotransferase
VSLTALKMVEEQEEASKRGEGAWVEPKALWADSSNDRPKLWSFWDKEFVYRISRSERVQGVMTLGTVIAIELRKEAEGGLGGECRGRYARFRGQPPYPNLSDPGYASSLALDFLTSLRKHVPISNESENGTPFAPFNMHSRPLGNVMYVMTSLWTERHVVKSIEEAIERKLAEGW